MTKSTKDSATQMALELSPPAESAAAALPNKHASSKVSFALAEKIEAAAERKEAEKNRRILSWSLHIL